MLGELHPQALRIAELLRARGEKLAVADGATGGLIMASLLTVPGALDFFVGGGVVYSFRARDVLLAQPREAYKGMRGASEDYALLQARAIRGNFHADWGLAERGSVGGGSTHPTGAPARRSRTTDRGLREALQPPTLPREPRQRNACRCLLRQGTRDHQTTRKDQAKDTRISALATPQARRLNIKTTKQHEAYTPYAYAASGAKCSDEGHLSRGKAGLVPPRPTATA